MPTSFTTSSYLASTWVVNPTAGKGSHTTIASALTSASSGDTILITPGTYTENITLKAGVNLTAFGCDGLTTYTTFSTPNVIILGTTTASYNGNCSCSGIQFKTNGAAAIATSGSNTSNLVLNGCSVYAFDSTGITHNSNTFKINFYDCSIISASTNNFFSVTTGQMGFLSCRFSNSGAASASTIAVSNVEFTSCNMAGLFITTSTTGHVTVNNCTWTFNNQTLLTTVGTGISFIYNSDLESGTASAISVGTGTTVNIANCEISSSNTNAITGAGTLNFGGLIFTSTSSTINTTTKTGFTAPITSGSSGQLVASAGAGLPAGFTTATFPSTATSTGTILRADGTNWVATTSTYPNTNAISTLLYASSANVMAALATANSAILATNSSGVPSITTASGNWLNTSRTAFLAYQASTATDVTGDGTVYTLGSTVDLTEIYDQASDFDPTTGTFTAPVTGRYTLKTMVRIQGATALTEVQLNIVTSNRSYFFRLNDVVGAGIAIYGPIVAVDADMDAADTATVTIETVDSGGKVDDIGGAADARTIFCGYLIC